MESLRQYMTALPRLADVVLDHLGERLETARIDANNAEDMRRAYQAAQREAVAALAARPSAYYVVTYPQLLSRCPTCKAEFSGAYWEVSNPVSGVRGQFRARLMHDFLVHGATRYAEPILNMSETELGVDTHVLDFRKLARVLAGLPLPQAAAGELLAAQKEAVK